MKKIAKNYRLNVGTIKLIELLSEKLEWTNTRVIEQSIMDMARKKCKTDEILAALIENEE